MKTTNTIALRGWGACQTMALWGFYPCGSSATLKPPYRRDIIRHFHHTFIIIVKKTTQFNYTIRLNPTRKSNTIHVQSLHIDPISQHDFHGTIRLDAAKTVLFRHKIPLNPASRTRMTGRVQIAPQRRTRTTGMTRYASSIARDRQKKKLYRYYNLIKTLQITFKIRS